MKRKKLSIEKLEIGRLTDDEQLNIRGGNDDGSILTGCQVTTPPGSGTGSNITCPATSSRPIIYTDLCI